MSGSRRRTVIGLLTAVLGLLILAHLVRRVGWTDVASALSDVGWAFALVLAFAGLRFLTRAFAWTLAVERPSSLPLADAFAATLCGDALGNVTPLGPLVGEPAKAAFVGPRLPVTAALAALAVENFFYSMSVAVVIAAGLAVLLLRFPLPEPLRLALVMSLAFVAAGIAGGTWLAIRRPPPAGAETGSSAGPPILRRYIDRIRSLERRLYDAYEHTRRRMPLLLGAELLFHLLGVAEIHVVLWRMTGAPPPILVSFVLETGNRLVTVLFKFVPLRVGVDEAGTTYLASLIGVGQPQALALALIRKARMLAWGMVGGLLLVNRGLSPRRLGGPLPSAAPSSGDSERR
jgi:hypothetical protein